MEEFGRIKDQVTSLENENARLRDVSLNVAKSEADQGIIFYRTELIVSVTRMPVYPWR